MATVQKTRKGMGRRNRRKYTPLPEYDEVLDEPPNPQIQPPADPPIPAKCQRCYFTDPQIRVHDMNNHRITYICYDCRAADPKLRDLPVKPRRRAAQASEFVLPSTDLEPIIASLPVPNDCERCQRKGIKEELSGVVNAQTGSVEFICYACKFG